MTLISVTVVYALPETAIEIEVRLPPGATVNDALERSGIATQHPEVNIAQCPVGIFGKRVHGQAFIANGDRIEIYRSLVADPKQTRRQRAKHGAG